MRKLLDVNENKPIYLQIAESIEDDILSGELCEGDQLPSTNQFADFYKINPATAGKGINLLVDEGIVFKKRGIGMFVANGALNCLKEKRKKGFYQDFVLKMLEEGKKLNISKDDIITMIQMEGN